MHFEAKGESDKKANYYLRATAGFALMLGFCLQAAPGCAQSSTGLAITPGSLSLEIGASKQLALAATDPNGGTVDETAHATWSSQDFRVVSVTSRGVATANATGTVAITASYGGRTTSIEVTSSVGNVNWSGPITITQGGTYSGAWRSQSAVLPAVTVATPEPVVIENSYVSGPNDLIVNAYYGNSLTVRNVVGIGTNANVVGQAAGLFVNESSPAMLDIENCYFENVRFGVWVRGYGGNRDGTQTIRFLHNRGRNMLGTESDGNNGYLPGETNWAWSHAIQLSDVGSVPGMEVAWNEIINYPGESLVNENINIYDSSGTAASPMTIHDNFIGGAYGFHPAVDGYNGGGMVTDGSGSDTMTNATAYIRVYNNQFVGLTNVGIEIGTGHDNAAYNNRVISSGLLPDGTKIPAQNVGLTVYDVYGNAKNGTFYNNQMWNNTVGWMCWAARCAWDGYRNDSWFPDDGTLYAANQSVTTTTIPLQAEYDEFFAWQAKLRASNAAVGPTAPPRTLAANAARAR